jgi:hypothetical protein
MAAQAGDGAAAAPAVARRANDTDCDAAFFFFDRYERKRRCKMCWDRAKDVTKDIDELHAKLLVEEAAIAQAAGAFRRASQGPDAAHVERVRKCDLDKSKLRSWLGKLEDKVFTYAAWDLHDGMP